MSKSIGAMKVAKPRLPVALARPRLFAQLEPSDSRAALWIVGPPGAGKTVLAACYLAEHKLRHIWYQIGAEDADLATFFHYLALAAPQKSTPLPHLTQEYLAGAPIFAQRFFELLYARLKPPFTIVLDNYQDLPGDAPLHGVLETAISMAPAGIQFLVLSRQSPLAAFARLRMHGMLQELDARMLAFTEDETRALATQRTQSTGPEIAAHTIHALRERTGGWAAGLVLLLEGGRSLDGRADTVTAASPDLLFEYFAAEIFARMDAAMREVLLKTAFLPYIDADSAAAVTGNDSAVDMFHDFSRRHYFTVRHADDTYHLHPLFREFLLRCAAHEFDAATLREFRRTAARALETTASENAIGLYLEAAAWDDAARLVCMLAPGLIEQGRQQSLVHWIEAVPQETVAASAWLQYWLGVSVLWDPPRAQASLESAFDLFRAHQDATGAFLAWSGVVEAMLYAWGSFTGLDRWIADMDALREQFPEFPSPMIEARVSFGMFCALHFRQPYHPAMPDWTTRAHALLATVPDTSFRIMSGAPLVFHYTSLGEMKKARHIVDMLQPIADPQQVTPMAFIVWAGLKAAYDWGVGAPNTDVLMTALDLVDRNGILVMRQMLLANRVYAALHYGDQTAAAAALYEMTALGDPRQATEYSHLHYLKAWAAYARGDAGQAYEDLQRAIQAGEQGGMYLGVVLNNLAMAQVLSALGREDEAQQQLAAVRQAGAAMGNTLIELHCRYIAAQIAHAHGRPEALGLIEDALRYARERDLMLVLWWNPATAFPLLAAALYAHIEVEYVQRVIRAHELQPPHPPLDIENWPWPVRIYTLGRFSIVRDGVAVKFAGKTQKKPLELLKLLIALGGRDVAADKIVDLLWPDAEGDAAAQALRVAVHRLRKLLGDERSIQVQDAGLTLDARVCWVDVWAFERLLPRTRLEGGITAEQVDACTRGLALYKGPFLGSEPGSAWSVPLAERLRLKFLRYTLGLGEHHEAQSRHAAAVDCYQRGLDVDNLVEEFYRRAIVCYQQLRRPAEARATYDRCRKIFQTTVGVEPSAELRRQIDNDAV